MKTETIKDIVTARWRFIASNAESIAKIARAMEEVEMLDAGALKEIRGYEADNDANLTSLEQLLDALGDSAKPFRSGKEMKNEPGNNVLEKRETR